MTTVKSLEDLKRLREEALKKREAKTTQGQAQVIVGMGTCGIAAGARETMKAILDEIETKNLSGIIVSQTGCIGLCEREPIVQVVVGDQPKVTYGKVTPTVARRIMAEHVVGNKVVSDHVIPMG
ncbi:MAG TPA: (2Fe-2S) ferredoxin domain-containing protein [Anaerolineaceae bacterium]|nr:(2Fe-2S) ferredoxin domain-containing protein [Anaerolineaceae bacterium]